MVSIPDPQLCGPSICAYWNRERRTLRVYAPRIYEVLLYHIADLASEFLGHSEWLAGWILSMRMFLDLMDRSCGGTIRNQVDE
jgi:hypothetical protein